MRTDRPSVHPSDISETVSCWKKLSFSFRCVLLAGLVAIITAGAVLGVFIHLRGSCAHEWEYLNETTSCDDKFIRKTGYVALRQSLESYIASERESGNIDTVSVYFKDLKDGPDFGINESARFISSSLLKLPIAMGVYEFSKDHPEVLETHVRILPEDTHELTPYVKPSKVVVVGQEYTVHELIRRMIVYSDNNALRGLVRFLQEETGDNGVVLNVLKNLGLLVPTSFDFEDISVRQYANLFRLLYNASYLSEFNSNELLAYLIDSEFVRGIDEGVPDGILVANKFGERYLESGIKQLHDCGIVYFPKNPYLLCILTRGDNFDELSSVIAEISGRFYDEIDSRRIPTRFEFGLIGHL